VVLVAAQKWNVAYQTKVISTQYGDDLMPDDKTKVGEPDRSRVSADQDYEVEHFAEKHGLTQQQVRDLIARFGNSREKLEKAAQELRAKR